MKGRFVKRNLKTHRRDLVRLVLSISTFLNILFLFTRTVWKKIVLIGEWLLQSLWFLPNTRKSHPVSKMLRPWLEHRRLRSMLGIQLILLVAMLGVFGRPSSTAASFEVNDFGVLYPEIAFVESPKEAVISTESRYQMPIETTGISQKFHRGHPGVDMRAPLGVKILPITDGVVRQVVRGEWGYGNALLIDHADNYSSMYAHVRRIFVEAGSSVDKNTVIAEVGTSGYTTGSHLHLETYYENRVVNPQIFLGY